MIEVRRYTSDDYQSWNHLVENGKNSTFLFKRDFMEYHKDRFNDYSLVVFENDVMLAAVPAHLVNESKLASHFGLTYGGIVFKKTENLDKSLLIFYKILCYLEERNIKKFIYKSFFKFYNSIGSEEITYAKFLVNAKLKSRHVTSAINLKDKLPFSKTRKRYIKKANKLGIIIQEVDSFDLFWNNILIPNLKNKFDAKPAHTLEEITKLKNLFPSNIRQFNAYLDNKIIAGSTIFETDTVARVQYNSCGIEGGNSGALDLLYNELMEKHFAHKNYFDFGSSANPSGLNSGLLSWKESFGARSFTMDVYEIKTKNSSLLKESLINLNVKGFLPDNLSG